MNRITVMIVLTLLSIHPNSITMDYDIMPNFGSFKPEIVHFDPAEGAAVYEDLAVFTGLAYPERGKDHLLIQMSDINVLKGKMPSIVFIGMCSSLTINKDINATVNRAFPHLSSGLIFGNIVPYARYLVIVKNASGYTEEGCEISNRDIISISPISLELGCDRTEIMRKRLLNPEIVFKWTED